jgi:hypothetical protein
LRQTVQNPRPGETLKDAVAEVISGAAALGKTNA